jgi:hypothetical protein
MNMRSATKRRLVWTAVIGLVLIAMIIGILVFADATAVLDEAKRCTPSIWQSQWPKYIGCAMAAHEGLAGGQIGAAGALFAAWLAFDAIQEQLTEERERRSRQQAEAKEAAVVCIAPSIHAAAMGLFAIDNAIHLKEPEHVADALVKLAVEHVHAEIDGFALRESVNGLGLDDRLLYLSIVGTLNVFVNISERPSPILGRMDRLQHQRHALMNLHTYLAAFDAELATVYARDSKTTPLGS